MTLSWNKIKFVMKVFIGVATFYSDAIKIKLSLPLTAHTLEVVKNEL